MSNIENSIAYFEETIRETEAIISGCLPEFRAGLEEQKEHYVTALSALRAQKEAEVAVTLPIGDDELGVGMP